MENLFILPVDDSDLICSNFSSLPRYGQTMERLFVSPSPFLLVER